MSDEEINKQRLIDEILWSLVTEQCYYHDCSNYSNRCSSDFLRIYFRSDEDHTAEWANWKQTDKCVALQQIAGTVSLMLDSIDEQWEDFLCHRYCTRIQQSYIGNHRCHNIHHSGIDKFRVIIT